MVKVAMMQMNVLTNECEKNLRNAEKLLREICSTDKPDFAVFPETCDIGWATDRAEELADLVPGGRACETWRNLARTFNLYIIAGLTEREGKEIYNCAVFFSPEGELLAKHRKINVLQDVEGMYATGDQLHVVHTKFGRVGFDICADNFISSTVLMHAMARMGAQMILSPSAWAAVPGYNNQKTPYGDIWRIPYSKIAKLYGIPVIGVSNVGRMEAGIWKGHDSIGNSMAYDGEGNEVVELPFGVDKETVHIVELELNEPIAKGTDFEAELLKRGYDGMAEEVKLAPKGGHGDGSANQ